MLFRSYHSSFKKIKYFQDGTDFVFFGVINYVKHYPNTGYTLFFEDQVWDGTKFCRANVFIGEGFLEKYYRAKSFTKMLEDFALLGSNLKATCYFVGEYPERKDRTTNDGKPFTIFQVIPKNLNNFVFKYDELE